MVRFNFWDKYFGERPKTFKKNAEKDIKENTLCYVQEYGRARWIKTEEIFKNTLEKTDFWNSNKGKLWFAINGIKSKIHWATHQLRKAGYPIIAGKSSKGYRYADENCDDFIHIWDEKFSVWRDRAEHLSLEARNDEELIKRIIIKLLESKRKSEAEKLQEILVKYKTKRKVIENEN